MPPCEGEKKHKTLEIAHSAIDSVICDAVNLISGFEDAVKDTRDSTDIGIDYVAAYKVGWAAGAEYAYKMLGAMLDKIEDAVDDEFALLHEEDS